MKQIAGTIGYVELAYARQNKLPFASIKNAAGAFVAPSVESATAAAEGVAAKLNAKTDYRISIANAPGAQAYPITSFTWLLVYQDQTDPIKGKKLVDFMRWALTSGQARRVAARLRTAPASDCRSTRRAPRLDSEWRMRRPRSSRAATTGAQCDVAVTRMVGPSRSGFSNNVQQLLPGGRQ